MRIGAPTQARGTKVCLYGAAYNLIQPPRKHYFKTYYLLKHHLSPASIISSVSIALSSRHQIQTNNMQ